MDARIYLGALSVTGAKTQTAGTVITQLIQPKVGGIARVNKINYTSGSTVHTLQFLRSQGSTTTTAAAAAGDSTITVASTSPITSDFSSATETLAANDWIAIQSTDGTYELAKVSSVSSLTITLTATLAKAVSSGATVYAFYELARAATAAGRPAILFYPTASTLSSIGCEDHASAIVDGVARGAPVMVHSDNATAAGYIQALAGAYLKI